VRCALNSLLLAVTFFVVSAGAQERYSFSGRVLDKKLLDSAHSVVLVDQEKPGPGRLALYIVSNGDNRELLALDAYSEVALAASPVLEAFNANSAYLHFYSDYGMYHGSIKYIFDLFGAKPPVKIRYGILALTSVARENDKLYYSASFAQPGQIFQDGWHAQRATVIVEPSDSGLPSYQITDGIAPRQEHNETAALRGSSGEVVLVQNTTPPGQPHRPSEIFVASGAGKGTYPVPIPTIDFYRQTLPQKQRPGEMESDIGPFVQSRDKIWFATTFYDSEGVSGIGAIGSFDIASRQYEMRYLAEIAPWSGSVILLDGDDLWIGLKRRPEGADIGRGLLRYNVRSGAIQTFGIPDVIFTLDRVGNALYCGSAHGLYLVRGDHITQLRFEPNESGQLAMIPRDVPQPAFVRPNAR
jgi:hypothetical protein